MVHIRIAGDSNSTSSCLLHGNSDGLLGNDLAEAFTAVKEHDCLVFTKHSRLRVGNYCPALQSIHVLADAHYSMGVHTE